MAHFWDTFTCWRMYTDSEAESDLLVQVFSHELLDCLSAAGDSVEGAQSLPMNQPRRLVLISDTLHLHVAWSNRVPESSHGVLDYFDRRGQPPHALEERLRELRGAAGADDWRGVALPRELLEMDSTRRQATIADMVHGIITSERTIAIERDREMYLQPIFSAREIRTDPDLAVVLMPFKEALWPIYEDHVKPTIQERCSMQCMRADDIFDNGSIVESVWELILRANLIIADLTGKNPNVFYEVGISHTVGKQVILISQSLDDVPFDLRHLRVVVYEHTPRGMRTFEETLISTIGTIQNERSERRR